LLPLPRQAPAGIDPRRFDFQAGINLSYIPRGDNNVTFQQLRQLGDAYYLLRTVIETRKDQIKKVNWRFGLKSGPGEAPSQVKERSENDPRVKQVEEFFMFPDRQHDWETWLGMWVEDMLVTDAPAFRVDRNRAGGLYALTQIAGETIKPVLAPDGTIPMAPETAYQQIIKGMVLAELTTEQLLYWPRNPRVHKLYGFSPVEQIIVIVNLGIRRALHQINFYTDGTIPDALCMVPDSWGADQIKQFQAWFDAALAGNLAKRRQVNFLPGGGDKGGNKANLIFPKDVQLKDDMDEFLARVVCFAFSLPPTAFVRQQNRATAQTAQQTALQEGLEPLKNYVKHRINFIIQHPSFMNFPDIEMVADEDDEPDQLKQAQIDDLQVRSGVRSIDELRVRDGLDPIGAGPAVFTMSGLILVKDAIKQSAKIAAAPLPQPGQTGGNGNAGGDGKTPGKKKPPAGDAAEKLEKFGHCHNHLEHENGCDLCEKVEEIRIFIEASALAKKADEVKKKVLTVSVANLPEKTKKRTKGLTKTIARFLKSQGKKIAEQAAEAYGHTTKADDDEVDRVLHDVELDWSSLVSSASDSLVDTAREAARETLLEIGVTDDAVFGLVNQDALDFATARAAEMVGMKFVNGELVTNPDALWAITDTTRDELRQLIADAFDAGMMPAELETAIRDSVQFGEARAEMIARTEMANAHVQGALAAAMRSGVVTGKYSLLGSEHDRDDECDDNAEAGEIKLADNFPSGQPGPPFHPNCVCGMNLVYESEGA
jgi:hypothetical protein